MLILESVHIIADFLFESYIVRSDVLSSLEIVLTFKSALISSSEIVDGVFTALFLPSFSSGTSVPVHTFEPSSAEILNNIILFLPRLSLGTSILVYALELSSLEILNDIVLFLLRLSLETSVPVHTLELSSLETYWDTPRKFTL